MAVSGICTSIILSIYLIINENIVIISLYINLLVQLEINNKNSCCEYS